MRLIGLPRLVAAAVLMVKSQGRWIIEAATHSVVSRAVHFGGSAIAAHPEIVDLEPNADARSVAITGRL